MKISIVMTTYNGAKYIDAQIASIIPYMDENDELIVSDDGSVDETKRIVQGYTERDSRIHLLNGPRQGVINNFEFALKNASGDIYMFSDQDDVWLPDKLPVIRSIFKNNPGIELLLHNMYLASNEEIAIGSFSKDSFSIRKRRHGVLYNILYSGYYGCCMAFSSSFKKKVIPFPDNVGMYDQFVGLIGEYYDSVVFLETPLIIHRVHGNNMSKRKGVIESVRDKMSLFQAYHSKIRALNCNR